VTIAGDGYIPPGTWISYSDRRLKKNIAPVMNSLQKVKKLRGVYFDWAQADAEGQALDGRRHLGFIAQDVQQAVPEAVSELANGKYLGVDYPALIPLLLEAIKELESNLAAMEQDTSVKILEAQNNLLQEQIERFRECDCSAARSHQYP